MKQIHLINSIAYIPRQDGQKNGNIGGHQIFLSTDGIQWNSPVATGTYQDDNSTKAAVFEATNAQFVRLMALTEAGGRGPWTSCASFNIFEATVPAPPRGEGEWSPTIDFPIVPVSAAIEHYSGNVVVWSSYSPSTFMGSSRGDTLTATYSPTTGLVAQRNVSETHHDMFCEGLSMDSSGRFIVTGGNNANQTSIYDPTTNAWSRGADMKIPRGYQSMVTLSNANLFTIGGSWSGGQGGKNGEVFDATSQTWTLLPGAPVAPMLTNDTGGIFRQDNHAMLFGWRNGSVFQAGPSKAMNWYNTIGEGNYTAAGTRNEDGDAMCGNAIMYDATEGKILVVGGAVDYEGYVRRGHHSHLKQGNFGNI